jgi:hypothetical protein
LAREGTERSTDLAVFKIARSGELPGLLLARSSQRISPPEPDRAILPRPAALDPLPTQEHEMSNKKLAILSSLIVATPPLLAQAPPADPVKAAPAAGPTARYCMRVAPAEGSLVEVLRCWTRDQWSEQGVDVDKAWAREGVSVREGGTGRP